MAIVTVPAEARRLTDPAEITAFLAAHGIHYERWPLEDRVDPASPAETILAAYAPEIDDLKRRGGFVTADVVDVYPDTPNLEVMLDKFRKEHTHTEDEVRFILIDPKRVELSGYNGLPHLLVPVITESEKASAALRWTVLEMENRYRLFAEAGARNLAAYNESRVDPRDRAPFIVVIIDELADLMMQDGRSTEEPIVRIAQKARATGIHLVLATQRPSVNVVTGLIKANIPSRIAFSMASQVDSRTVLDAPGAEDLIGRGDMLFQPSDAPKPIRLQGVFVSDKEIEGIVNHWRAQGLPDYRLEIVESAQPTAGGSGNPVDDNDRDRLFDEAVAVIQEHDRASASLLQRRLRVGYARAARIIDQLEAGGFIGAFDGSNARVVHRGGNAASTPNSDESDGRAE